MSRISLLLLTAVIFSVGCGYGSHSNYMGSMGGPQVMSLQPASAHAGDPAFKLTVEGSGFGTDSVIFFNMVAQTTTYDNTGEVTAEISAGDIMVPGMIPVYVRTGGKNSNSMNFSVQ